MCAFTSQIEIEDPYYLAIHFGIDEEYKKSGITIKKMYSNERLQALPSSSDFNGVIVVGTFTKDMVDQISAAFEHIVFVDSDTDDERFDAVTVNLDLGMKKILRFLFDNGIESIGYIGASDFPDQQTGTLD